MEAISKTLSLFDFQQQFPNDESCLKYLFDKKWENGYQCHRCKRKKYCHGRKEYDRRCTACGYVESPTANTLFHKVKFSLLKAFYIVYLVSTNKRGIASTELSRKLGLRQKTCWLFKQKVMQSMGSRKKYIISSEVEIMPCELGINHVIENGEKVKKKKLAVLAHEKKGSGRGNTYGHRVNNLSANELGIIFRDHLHKAAPIRTTGWTGFGPLQKEFPAMVALLPNQGKRPLVMSYRIGCGLLHWLRGTHGHAEHLQYYIDEYFFRLNRSDMEGDLFFHVIDRMINHEPRTYRDIVSYKPKALFSENSKILPKSA
ncbi:IS1595 family transposase [Membranihabitans marinus]|uniref:IS1595 family transposase n=1 Tax=Membranihabitans marinus TaxID=1227546 RepID=UPI001F25661F|nr:IS1595 family transposase [Membranihabitans marinus]